MSAHQLVEDARELNSTLCKYLNMNGYESAGCTDAQSAYDEMYGSRFDLIISDIMMPKIDGFEFAESVRDIDKDIPMQNYAALLKSPQLAEVGRGSTFTIGNL